KHLLLIVAVPAKQDVTSWVGVTEKGALVILERKPFEPIDRSLHLGPPLLRDEAILAGGFQRLTYLLRLARRCCAGAQADTAGEGHEHFVEPSDARKTRRQCRPRPLRLRLIGEGSKLHDATGSAGRLG